MAEAASAASLSADAIRAGGPGWFTVSVSPVESVDELVGAPLQSGASDVQERKASPG
jgi:hypothetical protein